MEVVGGIYSLQPLPTCWLTLLSMGTPDSLVHATSSDRWGLELLTIEVLCPLEASDSPVRSDLAVLTSDLCIVP
jgi:hypothetical protein